MYLADYMKKQMELVKKKREIEQAKNNSSSQTVTLEKLEDNKEKNKKINK